MGNSAFLAGVSDQHGVCVRRLALALKATKSELAFAAGLSPDSLTKAGRIGSEATQSRLLDMCGIIDRVIPWAGNARAAYAWYRSQSLASFGDATAEELVRLGWSDKVLAYVDRVSAGGYA